MSDSVGRTGGPAPVETRRDGGTRLPVAQPPTTLASLRPGSIVTGVVAGATEDGRTLVDTRHGRLSLAGLVGLTQGQAVRFEVVAAGDHVELVLLPPRSETLERGAVFAARLNVLAPAPAGLPSGALIAVADAPAALRALAIGTLLDGMLSIEDGVPVFAGAFGRMTLAAGAGAVAPGLARFAVVETGAGMALAADTPAPAPGGVADSFKAPLQSVLARLTHGIDTTQPRVEGLSLTIRVLALVAPGGAIEGGPGSLIGTVLDTQDGIARVRTSAGLLTFQVARAHALPNTAPGTQVAFQIVGQPGALLPPTLEDIRAQSINNLAQSWPALGEGLRALVALDPAAAAALVASLPAPGPQFLTGMAAFLSALFGGRAPDWLGATRRALDRHGQVSLGQRLTADAVELTRIAGDSTGNEWRAAFVPVLDHGAPTQVRLFLHGPRQGHGKKEKPAGTRFLVEADLSRLGPLQLDGLVHEARFDLIVRTQRPLDPALIREIEEVCAAARAAGGWTGGQTFQVSERFPVMPLSAASGHAVGVYA